MELRKAGSTDGDGKRESDDGLTEPQVNVGAMEQTPPPLPIGRKHKRKGCGCLLWVFGIILVALAGVAICPFLFRPNLYSCSSEDNSIICLILNKTQFYQLEHGHLPGLQKDIAGILLKNSPDGTYCVSTCGQNETHYVQTMAEMKGNSNKRVLLAFMDATGALEFCEEGGDSKTSGHAFRHLEISTDDITRGAGYRAHDERVLAEWNDVFVKDQLNPYYVQYMVPYSDVSGESYCYVVGVFDDEYDLHRGDGRAILTFFHNPSQTKILASFQRYTPREIGCRLFFMRHPLVDLPEGHSDREDRPGLLRLLPQSGFNGVPRSGGVVIPSLDGIIHASGRKEAENEIVKFKEALEGAGWDVL